MDVGAAAARGAVHRGGGDGDDDGSDILVGHWEGRLGRRLHQECSFSNC